MSSRWMAGVLLALLSLVTARAEPVETEAPARGLIVRLKQPLAHERLQRASAAARAADDAAAAREVGRWQRVLGEAGLSGSSGRVPPRLRPVGRDQQLVEFEHPLSRSEATLLRDKLLARPDVDWVEPNVRERRLQAVPDDPLFPQQWWLQPASGSNANALDARLRGVAGFQNAWLRAGAAPVVVAVLDTGVTRHPDLDGRVLAGYDFVSVLEYANDGDGRDPDPSDPGDYVTASDTASNLFAGCRLEDSSWHGTIVSGMVAAYTNNGLGGAGVHPTASVLAVRVAGKCGADLPDIIDGMRWAAGLRVTGVPANPNPARVVNISFGGSAACGPAYQAAVDELRALGVVVVAAAGNEWSAPTRPASCAGVVGVAGLNRDGFKSNYSNFGAELAASGIATVSGDDPDGAWGGTLADSGLVTLINLGRNAPGTPGYARLYGTSFAAPQVAGTLALMLGVNPALSYDQLVRGLRLSARPHVTSPKIGACSAANPGRCICSAETCGAGILDADQALVFASMPDSYVPPRRLAEVIDNVDVDAALALSPQDRGPKAVQVADAGDSGGGAFGGFWLLALAAAAITLPLVRPAAPRR